MMESAVKGVQKGGGRTNEKEKEVRGERELRLLTGGYFCDPGNSQESRHHRHTASRRARALHLLGALIQYLINSILSQSRDLAYSRGRAASILRAVAKGKRRRRRYRRK